MSQYQNASSKRHRPVDPSVDPAPIPTLPTSEEALVENVDGKTANLGSTGKRRKVVLKVAAKYSGDDVAQSSNARSFRAPNPDKRLCDLAGIDAALAQVKDMVFYPIKYPNLYVHLGVIAPCGLLFQGPSGCGKTTLGASLEYNLLTSCITIMPFSSCHCWRTRPPLLQGLGS